MAMLRRLPGCRLNSDPPLDQFRDESPDYAEHLRLVPQLVSPNNGLSLLTE
jgi:hypothetical protein